MAVFTEPEGQDYWLMPGETFELCADVRSINDEFEVELHELGLTAWPSINMGYISVQCQGKDLVCGHQRPKDDLTRIGDDIV